MGTNCECFINTRVPLMFFFPTIPNGGLEIDKTGLDQFHETHKLVWFVKKLKFAEENVKAQLETVLSFSKITRLVQTGFKITVSTGRLLFWSQKSKSFKSLKVVLKRNEEKKRKTSPKWPNFQNPSRYFTLTLNLNVCQLHRDISKFGYFNN